MCGIIGFLAEKGRLNAEDLRFQIRRMTAQLNHRGPDDGGEWIDGETGIALGHRRLSIIDLSPEGHQPMISADGRYVITYNGEIYNYKEIRADLEKNNGPLPWRGHSDTEILLAAFSHWGLEETLRRCNGMFAFALWDRKERSLCLARDRMGEKPLYYGWCNGIFLFGSELKPFRLHPAWQGGINRDALTLLLRYNCIPAPHSIYQGIFKLPPATWMRVFWANEGRYITEEPKEYWSVREAWEQGASNPFLGTEQEAEEAIKGLLYDSIGLRMVSDVPLGVFLSGGVDSSLVTALMQAQSSDPVRTFSIGFQEGEYNEAVQARSVAAHLGTNHIELYLSPEKTREVIPLLPRLYDEPFADSSQIPTFLVSQLARKYVTVALSGDGGDELFGGYNRHFWGPLLWKKINKLPFAFRETLARVFLSRSPSSWDSLLSLLNPVLPGWFRQRSPGYKLQKLSEILTCQNSQEVYINFASHWKDPERIIIGGKELPSIPLLPENWIFSESHFSENMMFLDMVTYLPDDILVKLDRASMGVGLEARVPYLDHRLAEFCCRLPLALKVRDKTGKYLLRKVLYRYVPAALVDRPKTGFSIPLDSWLRGPMRDWAESLLDAGRLRNEGFFNPEQIRIKWQEHLSGRFNWQYHLWDVLMFQAWLAEQKNP
jgi:asparagine synthase (glutamine-hydrolysing)